jgi:hypothetical protein
VRKLSDAGITSGSSIASIGLIGYLVGCEDRIELVVEDIRMPKPQWLGLRQVPRGPPMTKRRPYALFKCWAKEHLLEVHQCQFQQTIRLVPACAAFEH